MDNKLVLKIRKKNETYKPLTIDHSILTSYNDICIQINKLIKKDIKYVKDLKPLIIYLKHPKNKEIAIYDKDGWNILYNYNIINECVNKNTLKIDYEEIDESKNIKNNNLKEKNLNLILNNIMDKLPDNYYFHIISKFFSKNKYIEELFKQFFLKQIKESNINDIINIKNENLKEYINNLIKSNEMLKEKSIIQNDPNIKNLIKSNDVFKEKSIIQNDPNIKNLNTLKKIRDILEKNKEEEIIKINLDINHNVISDENIKINENKKDDGNKNILFNCDFDSNKLLDNNNYFKKIDEKEYYLEIQKFKNDIKMKNLIDM